MIEFVLNDTVVRSASPHGTPLIEVIRREQNLKATKLACGEGECGACTVLVGDLTAAGLKYRSITSCISPLINARGKHIVTLDGLNNGVLNPIQRAMVDQNGTQCGFCTPGFIVSIVGLFMGGERVTKAALIAAMDGNICRCTGYKSIERAAEQIVALYQQNVYTLSQLVDIKILPEYFLSIEERLSDLNNKNDVVTQTNINIGGGTDLYVQVPYQLRHSGLRAVSMEEVNKGITVCGNLCSIGAAETMANLQRSKVLREVIPEIREYLAPVGSTQIRNMATIGGNLVNASPIGDITIMLLALNADIILNENGHERKMKLKNFYLGYKRLNKTRKEIIRKVEFTVTEPQMHFHFERVCKRTFLDVASVNAACMLEYDKSNIITAAHLSAGGVAPIPLYLGNTSTFLEGKRVSAEVIKQAATIMQEEISPISDIRGSAQYKRLLLRQLFFIHMQRLFPELVNLQELVYT